MPSSQTLLEMFLSQIMRRWGMTSVACRLDWALFSAVDRIPLVKCWFCAKMWHNMSRVASLKFRRRPCDCFIKLCAAAGAMLALIVATATPFSSRCSILDWLPNCCSPLHFANTWSIWLEEPKKCWRFCWAHEEIVMARRSPSERFPRY